VNKVGESIPSQTYNLDFKKQLIINNLTSA
jgi:hypothetical protein